MIVDKENNVVFSYKTEQAVKENMESVIQEHLINDKSLDERKIWINEAVIKNTGWKIIYGLSPKDIISKVGKVSRQYFLIIEGVLTLFTIITILFINSLIKPLNKLKEGMKKVAKGNFNVSIDSESMDEIGVINTSFNRMTERLDILMTEIKEYQKKEQHLKFEALQAQINPHFIYNSLNAIKLAAEASQAYSIISMAEALGQLMKYCMNFSEEEVSVSQELLYIKQYVYLKNLQRIHKIDFDIIADESVYSRKILKFIIQPIVENAFIHGFKDKFKGKITVMLREQDGFLWVTISDTGCGLNGQSLEKLIENKKFSKKTESYVSIGLRNINERLKLKYGRAYSFSAKDGDCGGAVFTIKLPVVT